MAGPSSILFHYISQGFVFAYHHLQGNKHISQFFVLSPVILIFLMVWSYKQKIAEKVH